MSYMDKTIEEVHEALVKGKTVNQAGVPESFRVLIKEFQALGLDMQIIDKDDNVIEFKELEEEEDKEDTLKIEEIDAEASIRDGEIELKGEEEDMPEEDYEGDEEFEDDELEEFEDELDEKIETQGKDNEGEV